MSASYAHIHPYGSARYATDLEIRRAFRAKGGVPFGFHKGRKLTHSKNAGMLLLGGAGSGKFTSVLAHIMDTPGRSGQPQRYAILDPKREIRAVLEPYFAHIGARVYEVNPYGIHGVSGQNLSLLAHLTPRSLSLVADSRKAASTFVPEMSTGDARFFEQKSQNWLDAMMRGLVHLDGGVSPASLYELLGMVRGDHAAWLETSDLMASVGEPDLKVTFAEMFQMMEESERTYHSVLGEVANALSVMVDPALQSTFVETARADFTLDVLCEENDAPVFVFFCLPPELIAQSAPLLRQFFSALRTLKQRRPSAPTINLVIDEAAQLGTFPEIAEFYSVGRGFGLSPLCAYQSLGQITKNLGPTGSMTLQASADLELYLGGGISDLETARLLSQKLGNQTLHLEDRLTQGRARRAKREAVRAALLGGGDPVKAGMTLKGLEYEAGHTSKMARPLATPDEILGMDHDKALVLASSYGIPPFMAEKRPYYAMPAYAGLFAPNPNIDADVERVLVPTGRGKRRARMITAPVPEGFAHLPQYRDGFWRFVEGYQPQPAKPRSRAADLADRALAMIGLK
ncbi:MAG: type IV secretory system conjugative DNA transfer family protein [Pseudomonadota bacterium]